MELEIELREALESNPLLELTELNGQSQLTNGDATAANEPEVVAEPPGDAEAPTREELDYTEPDDFGLERFEYSSSTPAPDDGDGVEAQDQEAEEVRDHLVWQLNLSPLSARDRASGVTIVEAT